MGPRGDSPTRTLCNRQAELSVGCGTSGANKRPPTLPDPCPCSWGETCRMPMGVAIHTRGRLCTSPAFRSRASSMPLQQTAHNTTQQSEPTGQSVTAEEALRETFPGLCLASPDCRGLIGQTGATAGGTAGVQQRGPPQRCGMQRRTPIALQQDPKYRGWMSAAAGRKDTGREANGNFQGQ